jgi:hypothetical protein
MPWTISTYADLIAAGSPSNWRVALFELMRGVNERQAAIGITKTQFYKTDGTQAADLSMADILNIRASGVESNAEKNLKRVRGAIISMLNAGYFTEVSGSAVAWTKANMEIEIGADLDADPLRPQEARYWQAMQDALDRMIYSCREVEPDDHIGYDFSPTWSFGSYAAIQDAWDARADYHNSVHLSATCYWQIQEVSTNYRSRIIAGRTFDFLVPNYLGMPVGCAYQLTHQNDSSIIITYSVGSFDGTMSATEVGVLGSWKESPAADLALNSTTPVSIAITTPEPATVPFSSDGLMSISFVKSRIYIDLESVLSDQ